MILKYSNHFFLRIPLKTYNPLNAVLTGMIFLYIVSYSIFIIMLFVPFITTYNLGEKYELQKRIEEAKKYGLMLANEYEDTQIPWSLIILIIIIVGGTLMFNTYFNFISNYTLVNIFLAVSFHIPKLSKSYSYLEFTSENYSKLDSNWKI